MRATSKDISHLSRLKEQAAFDLLRKSKIRWVAKGFAIQAIPTTGSGQSFCIITSKKTAKLAVDRNKMRRRLRAVAYEILPSSAHANMSYMIVARKESLILPMDDLRRDLKWCIKKLNLDIHADTHSQKPD
jgi:ribonuclease P protein component